MVLRTMENARCPACGLDGFVHQSDCPRCRVPFTAKTTKPPARLTLAGMMMGVAATAVVFAAAKANVYAGVVVFFWIAPATTKTVIDVSRKRFGVGKTIFVFLDRLAIGIVSLITFFGGVMMTLLVLLFALFFIVNWLEQLFPQRRFSFLWEFVNYGATASGLALSLLTLKNLYKNQEISLALWDRNESTAPIDFEDLIERDADQIDASRL